MVFALRGMCGPPAVWRLLAWQFPSLGCIHHLKKDQTFHQFSMILFSVGAPRAGRFSIHFGEFVLLRGISQTTEDHFGRSGLWSSGVGIKMKCSVGIVLQILVQTITCSDVSFLYNVACLYKVTQHLVLCQLAYNCGLSHTFSFLGFLLFESRIICSIVHTCTVGNI